MVLADFPILAIFGGIIGFFLLFGWFVVLLMVLADIVGRDDIGVGLKILWTPIVILLPLLGVGIYLILYGRDLTKRRERGYGSGAKA